MKTKICEGFWFRGNDIDWMKGSPLDVSDILDCLPEMKYAAGFGSYPSLEFVHLVPWWMTLRAHINFEEALGRLHNIFTRSEILYGPRMGRLGALTALAYHFLHGVVCGYPMREIVEFLANEYRNIKIERQGWKAAQDCSGSVEKCLTSVPGVSG